MLKKAEKVLILGKKSVNILRKKGVLFLGRKTAGYILRRCVKLSRKPSLAKRALREYHIQQDELDPSLAAIELKSFSIKPLISVIMPMYKTSPEMIERAVESLLNQYYPEWELCAVDDNSQSPELVSAMKTHAGKNNRIKFKILDINKGISGASNEALAMAAGEYVALLDHDDELTPDALFRMVEAINTDPSLDWLFSDECRKKPDGKLCDFFFKPGWNPEMLLNYMYTGHLTLYRRSLALSAGGFRSEYDFSQDYDLALRISELTDKIKHIPRVLYHWCMVPGSGAEGGKPEARKSNIAALADAARRREWDAEVSAEPLANRVKFAKNPGKASLIIPSDSEKNILDTITAIRDKTSRENYEIIVAANSTLIDKLCKDCPNVIWVNYDLPYNFSDKCNQGAKAATGEFLVFINDDVRPRETGWLESLLEPLNIEGVGGVSPKLIYENNKIQYAGMFTGVRDFVATCFHTWNYDSPEYHQLLQCIRDVSVLTGACLAIRKSVFQKTGGFDTVNTPIEHSDFDLSFKILKAGLRCVYTPYSELTHIGHVALGKYEQTGSETKKSAAHDIFMLKRWSRYMIEDQYFPKPMINTLHNDLPADFNIYVPPSLKKESLAPKTKNAIFFIHELTISGSPMSMSEFAVALMNKGYFTVAVSAEDGPYRKTLLDLGITVIIDPMSLEGHWADVKFASQFDLIVVNTILQWPLISQMTSLENCWWWIHESKYVDELASDPVILQALQTQPKIICPTWISANYVLKNRNNPDGVHIITYGVIDRYDEVKSRKRDNPIPPAHDTPIRMLVLGSIEPRKGQVMAVRVMSALNNADQYKRNFTLSIAGRTLHREYRDKAENLAEGLDVKFVPPVSPEQAIQLIEEHDIVLIPSVDESFSLVGAEGMMLGKVCVISREAGVGEFIKHGENGFIIPHDNPEEIAEVLIEIASGKYDLREIGANARKTFLENFNMPIFHRNILAITCENT